MNPMPFQAILKANGHRKAGNGTSQQKVNFAPLFVYKTPSFRTTTDILPATKLHQRMTNMKVDNERMRKMIIESLDQLTR
jgi:hypothetical protein